MIIKGVFLYGNAKFIVSSIVFSCIFNDNAYVYGSHLKCKRVQEKRSDRVEVMDNLYLTIFLDIDCFSDH